MQIFITLNVNLLMADRMGRTEPNVTKLAVKHVSEVMTTPTFAALLTYN